VIASRSAGRQYRISQSFRRAYNRVVFSHIEMGLDLVEIDRIERILERHGDRFLARVYTDREIRDSDGRSESLAARFAAKEAVMKALGSGAMDFRDIEVVREPGDRPRVRLHGRARARAEAIGALGIALSLTHSRTTAGASVTLWSDGRAAESSAF
jgi:holo-[acyl-carrier protein] synthase